MKTINRKKASALLVAVGLLAVLSAMAFTFVTVMKIEMEVSVATKTTTQTVMLDQWAVQQVVDKLIRAPYQGAMYTPVDWAGEEWYTRPLIIGSPVMPTGCSMSFSAVLAGKGTFTIDARTIDGSSQINLTDFHYDDDDACDRKIRLLSALPFGTNTAGMPKPILGEEGARVLVDTLREIQEDPFGELLTKEMLLQKIMHKNEFKKLCKDAEAGYSPAQRVALYYLGESDSAGNVSRVGFKDFITLHSYVDERMLNTDLSKIENIYHQPRAPININTASSWTLEGVFGPMWSYDKNAWEPSIVSTEATITRDDTKTLVDYIIAYRTPWRYLSDEAVTGRGDSMREKQERLIGWISNCLTDPDDPDDPDPDPDDDTGDDYEPDPGANGATAHDALEAQLRRLAHLLTNHTPDGAVEDYLPRPFASWAQFDAFLKLLVYNGWGGSITEGRKKARAIMANCNPKVTHSDQPLRTDCVQWNCGKDKLEKATTELCFGSYGVFEIEIIVGQTSVVQAGALDAGPNPAAAVDFFGASRTSYDAFTTRNLDTEKVRTIKDSVYAPDRLCFFNGEREMIMMRSLYNTIKGSSNKVVLDRDVGPLASPLRGLGGADPLKYLKENVARWEIQRLESAKKWTAIVRFADTIRLSTVADFLHSEDTTGRGNGALYYPEPEGKKLKDPAPSLDDGTVDSTEIDGSIIMLTQDPEVEDLYLCDVFGTAESVGKIGSWPGSKYGPLFANGVWVKDSNTLKYDFYYIDRDHPGLFPKEPGSESDNTLTFTLGMWICLAEKGASGSIINTTAVKSGQLKEPILLEIADQELRATLKGVIEPENKKDGAPAPVTLTPEPIDISSWQPGEWHQVGLSFREDGGQLTIFATVNGDGESDVVTSSTAPPGGGQMKLYAKATGDVIIGPIDALVDDIVVSVGEGHANDPQSLMVPLRFRPSHYTSPNIRVSEFNDTDVEYGTVAWTQHVTAKTFLAEGFDNADAYVGVLKEGDLIEPMAGKCYRPDGKYDPKRQVPVWYDHDDLVIDASAENAVIAARIGTGGEGQRLGDPPSSLIPGPGYWTGTWSDGPVDTNVVGPSNVFIRAVVDMLGTEEDPGAGAGDDDQIERNIVTPCIDDITITFFPPMELLYWKMATEPTE